MYDVIIIGAGVVGATIARELSRYDLNTVILEKEFDVATGATQANSAIVHSGHDPLPGSLKAKFNVLGNRMYRKMSEELDIPLLDCGGMVVAINEEQVETIEELYNRALENGLKENEVKMLTFKEVREMEPNIADGVIKALYLPTTAVTFPWEVAIANIENAMDNGVELKTETIVESIEKNDVFKITTNNGVIEGKVVINASGVHAAHISKMIAETDFEITPRRGEYFVLDSDVKLVNSVIYPTPTTKGKGVIATPQVHGNTLLGPTSEFVDYGKTTSTTSNGLSYVRDNISKTVKNVPFNKVIRSFAGSRATGNSGDFIIEESNVAGFINVAGIESPGLTAAPAIAEQVVEEIVSKSLKLKNKTDFNPYRKVIRIRELSPDELDNLIKKDPRYGNVVCRCETITEGEIVDSIHRNCGSKSIVGAKMRVRPGAGRCQGGFCQPEILKILARELEIDPMDVVYSKSKSNILVSKTKGVE